MSTVEMGTDDMGTDDMDTVELHNRCFAFEADFSGDLRCLPMAVRRKLDLAGVKLKLVHWQHLGLEDRARLLAWQDNPGALAQLRAWLLERGENLPQGPVRLLEERGPWPWQNGQALPEVLLQACEQLQLPVPTAVQWGQLDALQRFALVKLSHPGHEHRNLPRALAEFGLLDDTLATGDSATEPGGTDGAFPNGQ